MVPGRQWVLVYARRRPVQVEQPIRSEQPCIRCLLDPQATRLAAVSTLLRPAMRSVWVPEALGRQQRPCQASLGPVQVAPLADRLVPPRLRRMLSILSSSRMVMRLLFELCNTSLSRSCLVLLPLLCLLSCSGTFFLLGCPSRIRTGFPPRHSFHLQFLFHTTGTTSGVMHGL